MVIKIAKKKKNDGVCIFSKDTVCKIKQYIYFSISLNIFEWSMACF